MADEALPALLAPGSSPWKAAAARLAEQVAHEDGLGAAEVLVTGSPGSPLPPRVQVALM